MTTPVDGKSFPNISANSAQFGLKGGYYVVAAIGTITTSVELQMLGPDGSTFVSLPTALKVTASGRWRLCASRPVSFHFNARGWNLLRSGTCEFRPIVVIMLPLRAGLA
jgi:hypothetical protein